jgi:flagellar basal-body rod protein FlgC
MSENLFQTLDIAGQGMTIQRKRLSAVANNIANVNTTRGLDGTPYQREIVVSQHNERRHFEAELENQINLSRTDGSHAPNTRTLLTEREKQTVTADTIREPKERLVHDPGHPDADAEGYVHYPDINIVTEMVDMITAQRGFEANTQIISTAKNLARYSLDI